MRASRTLRSTPNTKQRLNAVEKIYQETADSDTAHPDVREDPVMQEMYQVFEVDKGPEVLPDETLEIADVLLRHDSHAILDRLFASHKNRETRHDFLHLGLYGGLSLQDDLARVITLGKNTDQLPLKNHQQDTHGLFRHDCYRIVDTRFRRDVPNVLALLFQYYANRVDLVTKRPCLMCDHAAAILSYQAFPNSGY
jgi:hypothetical protein